MVQFDQTYKKEFAPVKIEEMGQIVKTVINLKKKLHFGHLELSLRILNWETDETDEISSVTIDNFGDFEVAKDNTIIYKGSENQITLARAYTSK